MRRFPAVLLFLIFASAASACHEEGQVQVSGFDLKGVESIDKSRLQAFGRGWDEPVSEKSDENRRVEVQWFLVE